MASTHHRSAHPSLETRALEDPPTRRRLAALVRQRPGLTLSEARRELGIAWGLLAHHIHTLVRQGRAVTVPARGRTLIFAAPVRSIEGLAQAAALQGTARLIAGTIVRAPGISAPELQWMTGASRRATYYHLRRLVDAKLVTSERPRCLRDLRPSSALVRSFAIASPDAEGSP